MGRGAAPKPEPELHEPADPQGFGEAADAVQREKAEDEAVLAAERLPPEQAPLDPAYIRAVERVTNALMVGASLLFGQLDPEIGSSLLDGIPEGSSFLSENTAHWLQGKYAGPIKTLAFLASWGNFALRKKAEQLHARARAATAPKPPPPREESSATRALPVPQAMS